MKSLTKCLCTLLVTISVATAVNAQKFKVSWGDNAKLKYDFEDAVPLINNQFLVLKLKSSPKLSLFGAGSVQQEPSLVLVDKNMETLNEREIPIEEKNASL